MAEPRRPSFTKPPVAPPAAPLNPNGPPLKRGQIHTVVTEGTQRQLAAIGVKPGEQPPPNLADKIDQVRRKFDAEYASTKAEIEKLGKTDRLKKAPIKDLSELPPEAIKELTEFVEQYREAPDSSNEPFQVHDQSVLAAIAQTQAIVNRQQAEGTEVLIEDEVTPPAAEPAPAPASAPAATDAVAPLPIHHCPRCSWDMNIAFNAEPSTEDVQNFVIAILGNNRFIKNVPLMDGKLSVSYRTLTAKESRMILQQLRYDTLAGRVASEAEWLTNMLEYRLVCGLAALYDDSGAAVIEIPASEDWHFTVDDPTKETPLLKMCEWFNDEGITSEPLRRIVGTYHRQFQRIVETLESRTAEPNFWKGIDSPH